MKRRAALGAVVILFALILPSSPAGAGGFCHEGGTTQKATTVVDMKGNCFSPTVTQIGVGDKITWTNSDGDNHIILGVGGSWGTPEVGPGESTAMRFERAGVYPYWCHIHLGMVGAVVVGDGGAIAGGAGGSGAGPVATAAVADAEPEPADDEPSAGEGTERAGATAVGGIDRGALAIAGALVVAVAGFALIHGRPGPMASRRSGSLSREAV